MSYNYEELPLYYWYTTKYTVHGESRSYFYKGIQYVGYPNEPEPNVLDQYKLTFKGIGTIDFVEGGY